MTKVKPDHGEILLYQSENGQASVDVYLADDTVWLNQAQMVELFQRDQSVISRHLNNVFKEGELPKQSNMQKMHIANSDKPVATRHLYRRLFRSTLLLDSILEMTVLFGVVS